MNSIYLLLTTLSLLIANVVAGQSTAPYLIIKPVYAFGANAQKIGENVRTVKVNNGSRTTQIGIYGSSGKGFIPEIGLGKMINANFGFELNLAYLFGSKSTANQYLPDISGLMTASTHVRGALIQPSIVLRNSGNLLSVYTRLGLCVSIAARRYENLNFSYAGDSGFVSFEAATVEKAKPKIGYTACLGLAFRIAGSVSLVAELDGRMLSLPFVKGEIKSYKINGKDEYSTLDVSDAKWEYVKEINNDLINANEPNKRLFEPVNASSFGVGIGLIYHF